MVAKRSSGLRRGRRRDVRSSQQAQDRPEVKRNEIESSVAYQRPTGAAGSGRSSPASRGRTGQRLLWQGMPIGLVLVR